MSDSRDFLIDTHALLWLASDDPRLSDEARSVVLESRHRLYLSVASVWELAIKKSLGRLTLALPLSDFIEGQKRSLHFRLLDIEYRPALLVETLPFHHRDPFDRLLAAQALHGEMSFLSADAIFDQYGVRRCW